MSWTVYVTLFCDEDFCTNFLEPGADSRTVGQARFAAAERGWSVQEGKDYCPIHTPLVMAGV